MIDDLESYEDKGSLDETIDSNDPVESDQHHGSALKEEEGIHRMPGIGERIRSKKRRKRRRIRECTSSGYMDHFSPIGDSIRGKNRYWNRRMQ